MTSSLASGASTAWALLWRTRSRPIGVRVCLFAEFNFFTTAFDPRAWTLVVFWKERFGTSAPTDYASRTKEEIIPIIHLFRFVLSLMILEFPLVHKVHNIWRLLNLISLQDRQGRRVFRQEVNHQLHLLITIS